MSLISNILFSLYAEFLCFEIFSQNAKINILLVKGAILEQWTFIRLPYTK